MYKKLQVSVKRNDVLVVYFNYTIAVGNVGCCLFTERFPGLYSFLALCDYCTKNRNFGDPVIVVNMLVLFTVVSYVEFRYAVQIASSVCDILVY